MCLFEFFEFAHHPVVLGIRDLGLVQNIITVIVVLDLFPKFLHPFLDGIGHHVSPGLIVGLSRADVDFPLGYGNGRRFDASLFILSLILDRSREIVNLIKINVEADAYFLGRLFHIHHVVRSKSVSPRCCICERAGEGSIKYKILLDKLMLLLYF